MVPIQSPVIIREEGRSSAGQMQPSWSSPPCKGGRVGCSPRGTLDGASGGSRSSSPFGNRPLRRQEALVARVGGGLKEGVEETDQRSIHGFRPG